MYADTGDGCLPYKIEKLKKTAYIFFYGLLTTVTLIQLPTRMSELPVFYSGIKRSRSEMTGIEMAMSYLRNLSIYPFYEILSSMSLDSLQRLKDTYQEYDNRLHKWQRRLLKTEIQCFHKQPKPTVEYTFNDC